MRDQLSNGGQLFYNFGQQIVMAVPTILGALIILLIGYIIAKAVASVIGKALGAVRLNQRLHAGKGGNIIQRAIPDPTHVITQIAYWVIFLFGLSLAASFLGIPALVDFIRAIYAYLPNVLAAILIFLVAGALSAGVATLVSNTMGDTPTGKVVGTAAPVLVMVIAVFMILNQLKIAPEIVTITYAALLGSVALGMAIAFGLGGREAASQILNEAYAKGRQQTGQVRRDAKVGADRATDKARQIRDKA